MNNATLTQLHAIVGDAGYVTDPARVAPFLVDERRLYEGRAAAVIQPGSLDQLSRAVRVCSEAGVGMVPQGGNTGYCGGATPDESGTQVLINLSRMNRIRNIDTDAFTLTADAGVVLSAAQQAAAQCNLLLPLSMGSEGSCQLGGVVSTNAGGTAVLRYGTARELVAGLEVVLPDGRIWSDLHGLRKDNTGYDLKQLFAGAEGTLGIISGVVLRLFPQPRAMVTAWIAARDIGEAVRILADARSHLGDCITSFEYVSREALKFVLALRRELRDPLPDVDTDIVLVELGAFDDGASLNEDFGEFLVAQKLGDEAVIARNEMQRAELWRLRELIPEAEKNEGGSIKHDVSVSLGQLGEFVADAAGAVRRQFPGCRLSIFGHVGDGNVHFNVLAPNARLADEFRRENASVVSALIHGMAADRGGSFSAEHGVGRLKRDLLAQTSDTVSMALMWQIKNALDPHRLMNPGKVLWEPAAVDASD